MPKKQDINKILIIGSGPIIIGQACEFDYSGTQACKALRRLGYQIVLVNSNPATIMTDPDVADITYIEPLNVDRLTQIIEKERPDSILPTLGGQTGLNTALELAKSGVLDECGVELDSMEQAAGFAMTNKAAYTVFYNAMRQLSFGLNNYLNLVNVPLVVLGHDAAFLPEAEKREIAGKF